jgi:hypothetical protein
MFYRKLQHVATLQSWRCCISQLLLEFPTIIPNTWFLLLHQKIIMDWSTIASYNLNPKAHHDSNFSHGKYCHAYYWLYMGFGFDDWIYCTLYIHNSGLEVIQRYCYLHTLQFTIPHTLGFSVFTSLSQQRIYHSLTVTSNHIWSHLFTAKCLSCHYSVTAISENSTQFNSSAPKLIFWQAGILKLDSPLSTNVLWCSMLPNTSL